MLLEHFIPEYHFSEYHQIPTNASTEHIYESIEKLDLSTSIITRTLYAIRRMPAHAVTLKGMEEVGFSILGKQQNKELVFGIIGRFWKIPPEIISIDNDKFESFNTKGYAKAAANIMIKEIGNKETIVSTETRVLCTSPGSRIRFLIYWMFIRPFSGIIRKEMLRIIKQEAERKTNSSQQNIRRRESMP